MSEWTTNGLGGTQKNPCPRCVLGVCLCSRDDVRAWGDRVDELVRTIDAEVPVFMAWGEGIEKGTPEHDDLTRITLRLLDWQGKAASVPRDSVLSFNATAKVREQVDFLSEGAAVLESMRARRNIDPTPSTRPVAGNGSGWLWAIGGAAALGLLVWGMSE